MASKEDSFTRISDLASQLTILSQDYSAKQIHILESNEYLKHSKNYLKDLKCKIQTLQSEISDACKLKDELITKNKVNTTNMESLFQTQSEFYNYKCQVKTDYIAAEEGVKLKKMKYEKIVSTYKSEWETAQKEFQKLPLVGELATLSRANSELEEESKKFTELFERVTIEYSRELQSQLESINCKVIELAKEYKTHLKLTDIQKRINNKSTELKELLQKADLKDEKVKHEKHLKKNILQFSFHRKEMGKRKDEFAITNVDLSAFDNILVPLESLETQNEEDMPEYPETSKCINLDQSIYSEQDHESKPDFDSYQIMDRKNDSFEENSNAGLPEDHSMMYSQEIEKESAGSGDLDKDFEFRSETSCGSKKLMSYWDLSRKESIDKNAMANFPLQENPMIKHKNLNKDSAQVVQKKRRYSVVEKKMKDPASMNEGNENEVSLNMKDNLESQYNELNLSKDSSMHDLDGTYVMDDTNGGSSFTKQSKKKVEEDEKPSNTFSFFSSGKTTTTSSIFNLF